MDYKDKLLLKVVKYINVKLGNVQDDTIILFVNDSFFTNEDRHFLPDAILRLVQEFEIIENPTNQEVDRYEITADRDGISSLYTYLENKNTNASINKNNNVKIYKNLSIDLKRATLNFQDNEIEINPDNKSIRMLILLIENVGKIVGYKEIAKKLDLNCYHEYGDDKSHARDVGSYKRDMIKSLSLLGKDKASKIRDLIISKKNQGYMLRE